MNAIQGIYDCGYFKSWGMESGDSEVVKRMKSKTFNHLLGLIEKDMKPGCLLDVGCAAGHLLEAAILRGWEPYGVEISEYAATLARKKFGNNIYHSAFESVSLPENFFDLIIMSDLIEHLTDPTSAIHKAHKILKKQGLLVIITPDTSSLSAFLLKTAWNHFHKDHLFYFNRKNISLFLKRNNFLPYIIKAYSKYLNIDYVHSQLATYPHKFFTPMVKIMARLLPGKICVLDFPILEGDMCALSRRISWGK
jgi:2-polyprenyl-3-methyl-5-hydroxy-6-metoxy-1,4-benzoquinol methylase